MQVNKKGILGRWYRYWVEKGGQQPRQENFCHFCQVIFLYAPARWFLLASTKKIITPWSVVLSVLLIAALVTHPGDTLKALALIIGAVSVVAAIVGIAYLIDTNDTIFNITRNVSETIESVCGYEIAGHIKVGWIALIASYITLAYFAPEVFLVVTIICALFAAGVAAIFIFIGIVAGGLFVSKRSMSFVNAHYPVTVLEIHSFYQTLKEAKRKSICPYVDFVESNSESEMKRK